jgi:hypothetical protein
MHRKQVPEENMGHADLGLQTAARERWVDQRADSLMQQLIDGGEAQVVPMWAMADAVTRRVPLVRDFISWLHECRNGDADVAVCMFAPSAARLRLICAFAEERAQMELDALPADYFSEVA